MKASIWSVKSRTKKTTIYTLTQIGTHEGKANQYLVNVMQGPNQLLFFAMPGSGQPTNEEVKLEVKLEVKKQAGV